MTDDASFPIGLPSWLSRARSRLPAPVDRDTKTSLADPGLSKHLISIRDRAANWTPAPHPPLRGLYHLACTGGTVISQCLAAQPNTQLLSEVDPLSQMSFDQPFTPTDMVSLAHFASRPSGDATTVRMFQASLRALYDDARKTGTAVILRAHSHSQFCYGPINPERPSLHDMVKDQYRLLSLVTVRHPLDSYLSLRNNGWVNFTPGTLEEYCRRYTVFLDHHAGIDILKYEDLLEEPERHMQWVCDLLELTYSADFKRLFNVIPLSGNSGRSGGTLSPRPRRPILNSVAAEIGNSPTYTALCKRLGYSAG